jgi:hypothetical protein
MTDEDEEEKKTGGSCAGSYTTIRPTRIILFGNISGGSLPIRTKRLFCPQLLGYASSQ